MYALEIGLKVLQFGRPRVLPIVVVMAVTRGEYHARPWIGPLADVCQRINAFDVAHAWAG